MNEYIMLTDYDAYYSIENIKEMLLNFHHSYESAADWILSYGVIDNFCWMGDTIS